MKKLILMALAMTLMGCQGDKNNKDDAGPSAPSLLPNLQPAISTGVTGMYEYATNLNCTTAPEMFGDSIRGCVDYIQITRFADKSGFIAIGTWGAPPFEYSFFLAPSTNRFSKSLHYSDSGHISAYDIEGDLSGTIPTISMSYDSNGNVNDNPFKVFSVNQVYP